MNVLARDWRIARAQAERLLARLFNEAEHPRDEHGRWTDGGGSDDAPAAAPPPTASGPVLKKGPLPTQALVVQAGNELTNRGRHEVEVLVNPTASLMTSLAKGGGSKVRAMRAMRDDHANMYTWLAEDAIHHEVAVSLNSVSDGALTFDQTTLDILEPSANGTLSKYALSLIKTGQENAKRYEEQNPAVAASVAPAAAPKQTFDIGAVEQKTKVNVAEASEAALKAGTEHLPGNKGEHPATIASRNPTAKGSKKNPAAPIAYGQPDVESMKLDPERYAHDVGLFANDDFYPNFRKDEFAGSTDEAVTSIVGQMKDNLKWLYQFADEHTEVWYDGARALVDDRVKLWGFNDASVAAVYAALSPTKDWDQNVHIADMLLQTYKNQQGTKWSAEMDAKSKTLWSAANQKMVALVKGKTLGELTDPAHKAIWIRTYDETHNKAEYRTVLPNGALGAVAKNADGSNAKVVWQSLAAIKNAVVALEANGDREKISAAMGTAHKVRSFYNNILDPHSKNGDVTIDTHAVGAALLRQLSNKTVAVAHNFGNTPMKEDQPEGWDAAGSSSKTGLSGLYPVYAQAYREAAKELGIQPRQLQSAVWVVKRNTFGELSKADRAAVEAAWHAYHDDSSVTLEQTRLEIARILRLGKHERYYRPVEGSGHPGHAVELHRGQLGFAVARVDSRAGAGVARGAAGLDAVQGGERRVDLEVKKDAHGDWMDECVPKLMGYGKDQLESVAACLNMWREAWEETHPDGADDPGPSPKEADPDSPLAEDAKEKMLARARVYVRLFNEAEHPRDEHGRWTDGGGGDDVEGTLPSSPVEPVETNPWKLTASGKGIKGLPNDVVIKDHLMGQAQAREGVWEMEATEKKEDGAGRTQFNVTITAKIPGHIKPFVNRPGADEKRPDRIWYYDPELATLETTDKGVQYLERTYAKPKEGLAREIEPLPEKDIIYRGMRAEEYEKFLETGEIVTTGHYNMEGQEGLTYWGSDPGIAQSYANGFAPWPHKATFEKPAYVVAARRPSAEHIRKVEGTGENEVGVSRAVTKDEIVGVWRGDVFQHSPGDQDIRQSSYDPDEKVYETGGGSGPSSDLVWQRVDAPSPAPSTGDEPDDGMLFVSEMPNQAKLDKWNGVLSARSEELAAQGEAGNQEDDQISRMQTALANFSQESEVLLQSGDAGLNAVYDSNMRLQAAAFAYVRNKVATIQNFGALKHAAGVKALNQAALKYGNKTDQIEGDIWEDDTASRAMYEEAGYKQRGEAEGGRITMVKTDLPEGGVTKMRASLVRAAESTAKKLDFDPSQITYTNETREFQLAGQKYKYAGSYQLGDTKVKLYMGQLNSENIKGVTAHEIGHRKFDMLTKAHKIETEIMMQDKGPPPDPNHQYWWGKKGGTDAMMTPTGEMRPPYDTKYPIVHEWAKIQNMRPSLEQDDGITDYSKTYWKEWEKGAVNTNTAYHETMAEISRAIGKMGKHSAETGSGWRRLYRLQEKVWVDKAHMREISFLPENKSIGFERVVIDSRKAIINYLDDDFTPVEPEQATLIKIVFDDGEIIFVTPDAGEAEAKMAVANLEEMRALLRAKRIRSQFAAAKRQSAKLLDKYFDESKHPRDQGGKFSETGGEPVDGEREGGGGGGSSKRKEGETDKEFAKRVVDKRPAPKELPEKHEDYFNMEDATVMPLDKLVSGKTAEENKQGGDNGAKRMAAAAKGELSKRDPITVEPTGDGKYLITDGNGTFTTVQKYGWKSIPVKIEGGAEADVTNQASVSGSSYKPKPPGLKAEAGTMKKVRQTWVDESPIQTMDDVIREAPKAQATLGKIANDVAAKLGVEYIHPTAKTQTRDKVTGEIIENPKGVARIQEKIDEKEKLGEKVPMARITDAARGTFVLNRESDARKVIDELAKSYEMIDEGWRTIPDSHYTDRPLLFRDPKTGVIGEIQLTHPALLDAKQNKGGHEMYEEARSPKTSEARAEELFSRMRALYGSVLNKLPPEWKKIDGRRGSGLRF